MEMPEQELPVVFSQMLRMFPNIPQDIIWLYVQQYSRDIEKCAQMLNLQNSKYTDLKSTLNTSQNLNENNNVLQASHFVLHSESTLDNTNDVPFSAQAPLLNSESDAINKFVIDKDQVEEVTYSSPSQPFSNVISRNNFTDSLEDLRKTKFINFNEPLVLDIVPDDDDISHSWRPNVSADTLCSDLFVPSPMSENFHLNSNLIPSLNFERNNSQVILNPEGVNQEPWRSSNNSLHMLYSYTQQNERHYEKDIASYLHYQKSQMNAIRYEVIKAKIEQSDLKEEVEKLSYELKEKMQSKSVQDIEELNEEIVQLRLECQSLCTDVDQILNDQGLLGEVDEKCYEKNNSLLKSSGTEDKTCSRCGNSNRETANDSHDDSNRWQCPKCTFANHSAISVCEMCSAPKPSIHRSFMHAPPSSCYCHPKEESLSVHS